MLTIQARGNIYLVFESCWLGNVLKSFPTTDGLVPLIAGFLQRNLLASSMVLCSFTDRRLASSCLVQIHTGHHRISQMDAMCGSVSTFSSKPFMRKPPKVTETRGSLWSRGGCVPRSPVILSFSRVSLRRAVLGSFCIRAGWVEVFSLARSLNMLSWTLYLSDS